MLSPSFETIRVFLHLLSAAVWVGGQFALAGMVPKLRAVGPEATTAAANGFARVAWPAFAVSFLTGVWSLFAVDATNELDYQITFGIKIVLVAVAGLSAAAHATSDRKPVIAATGALGGLSAIAIVFLGVLLSGSSV